MTSTVTETSHVHVGPHDLPQVLPDELPVKDFFDLVGDRYERAYAGNPQHLKVLQLLHSRLKPASSILDMGCGTGRPASFVLSSLGHQVTGIDLSSTMISLCRKSVPSATFSRINMTEYKPDKPLDAVCSFYALFQLPRRAVVTQIYRVARWLKPGGHLALSTVPWGDFDEYVPTTLTRDLESVENGVPFWWMHLISTTTTMSVTFWDELFCAAGFRLVYQERYVYRPNDPEVEVDRQYWVIAEKLEDREPCLGPWPIPSHVETPGPLGLPGFEQRIVGLDSLLQGRSKGQGRDGIIRLYSLPDLDITAQDICDSTVVTLVQHAPENEVLNLLRDICLPGMPVPVHQGYLLQKAKSNLAQIGLNDVTFEVQDAFVDWRDVAEDGRIETAAREIVAWMWPNDSHAEQVREAAAEHLEVYWSRGKDRGEDWDGRLGFAAVVMKAKKPAL